MSHEAHEARHRERTQLGLTFLRLSATLRGRQLGHKLREAFRMKLIIALAAAGIVSSLAVTTPALAQKNSACVEKCNREIAYSRGGPQDIRSVGNRRSACIQACPAAAEQGGSKKK
jgi:hypothetical protein